MGGWVLGGGEIGKRNVYKVVRCPAGRDPRAGLGGGGGQFPLIVD